MVSSLIRAIRTLFLQALRERSSPRETGLSVAVGAFCACTPFIGFHVLMALGLATVFRLNRLWAALGSRASPLVLLPFIAFSEVQLAHRLRRGCWVPISPREVLAHGHELLLDWGLGTPIVGGAFAVVLGGLAYAFSRARLARVTPNTPGEPHRPSSGSRPSAPPTPSP
jgi:uncharacterized protein (DUF2062 family)